MTDQDPDGAATQDDLTDETVELLRELIRNACVNDGTADSGHEHRSVATLERFFAGVDREKAGMTWDVVEPHPGRQSLVVRILGSDPEAPALLLCGHTDVVPVAGGWQRDPFGAELVDGVVWGRGALDMLHLTASYAAIVRRIAADGTRLRGDLVFAAVADEENGGALGAGWLTQHRPDLVKADGVLSETGGAPLAVDGVVRGVTVTVAEKGLSGRELVVSGHPRHASTPWGSSNAVETAALAVSRIVAHPNAAVVDDLWPLYVDALDVDSQLASDLVDPERLNDALPQLGELAGLAHAVTHTTYSPTISRGGDKLNVIPGSATVQFDIRTLPGVTPADVDAHLRAALGELTDRVRVEPLRDGPASRSPQDTPLFRALDDAVAAAYPSARAVPVVAPGGSDSRYFRWQGVPAYGFGLLSDRWRHADFRALLHSTDERIDVASVGLVVRALERVVRQVLG